MIKLDHLSLQRGPQRLLENANLTLHAGQKVGLIGANGAGKSSLFALLLGQLHPDAGDCQLPDNWRLAHMRQEVNDLSRRALDYVLDGDQRLRQVQALLAEAQAAADGQAIAHLHAELETLDGYSAEVRGRKLLAGLGFGEQQMEQQMGDFSGGWRMRLNLAQALMCPSDLLLLDEPTNHLDLDTILWLEGWLQSSPGTLLLISHDREFLDSVVDHVVHFDQRQLTLYLGNYSTFERTRAKRLAQQQQSYQKQQAQRQHMESFVRRFKAKASKARQAQSRLKALERMEVLAPAHVDSPFDFCFREADKTSPPLFELGQGQLGYPSKRVLEGVNLQITPGARVGLLGPNGAGKSTLIKTIVGELELLAGRLTRGENLKLGYFAQHQFDALDAQASPLLHLQRLALTEREQSLRDFLGGFDFRGERCDEPVVNFSGGEKARLALALIAWSKPNLLLLDEPTNHLDLEMRLALSLALQAFSGAVLVVSHDRHLLRSTVDEFVLISDGQLQPFTGDLDDYARWLVDYRSRQGMVRAPRAKAEPPAAVPRAVNVRRRLAPQRREVERLERQLETVQARLTKLQQALNDVDLYAPERKDELQQLVDQQQALQGQQAELEESWLAAQEELELLQQQL